MMVKMQVCVRGREPFEEQAVNTAAAHSMAVNFIVNGYSKVDLEANKTHYFPSGMIEEVVVDNEEVE